MPDQYYQVAMNDFWRWAKVDFFVDHAHHPWSSLLYSTNVLYDMKLNKTAIFRHFQIFVKCTWYLPFTWYWLGDLYPLQKTTKWWFWGEGCFFRLILGVRSIRGFEETFVTGFAKRGLPHTSTLMSLRDHNIVMGYDINLKFSPSIVLFWLLCTVKISSQWYSLVWSYESLKLAIWMCVEDP